MCGCTLNGILAAIPARSTNFCKPDTENGAPRSLTNMKGDSASRLSARNALISSPSNGCVLVCPPLALRRCRVPDANSTSDHCRLQISDARRPCRNAIRSIVLSRWPERLPLAVWISFSTSRSVRCSRGRSSLLGRRVGVTVRFIVAGETSAALQNRDRRRPLNGLRATELVDLRWEQVDLKGGVRRVKQGTPATHPLTGRELRARP